MTNLKIAFETNGKTRFMSESEFRHALAGALAQAGEYMPSAPIGAAKNALSAAAELIAALPSETSWLGTFTVLADQYATEHRVPDGLECPRCGNDQMDAIVPQDSGIMVCDCGCVYSGDTSHGRPEWYQPGPGARKLWYVPGRNVYVSIPD